ncbi:MAG: hypothetical protein HXY40_04815 [Chloroflexi bacterium]|nr:hypothetical protein [Chloroflexota bacterium]
MAYYLVKAKPLRLKELKALLDGGGIRAMRPFGGELQTCLENARLDPEGFALWEENCYCTPPLAQERAAVLDQYFVDIQTKTIEKDAGWAAINALPPLW